MSLFINSFKSNWFDFCESVKSVPFNQHSPHHPVAQDDGPWRFRQDPDRDHATDSEEGGENQADGEEQPKQHERPATRGEMQKLRDRFENSMKLVAHLYKDISLRDEFRMVSIATKSFMVEYSKSFPRTLFGLKF